LRALSFFPWEPHGCVDYSARKGERWFSFRYYLTILRSKHLELSKRLGISQPTASQWVKRGEKIMKEKQLKLMG
jgi:hypothetical protein